MPKTAAQLQKQRGDTWWHRGYDLAEAERMAKQRADGLAEKFVGDWDVVVAKKTTGAGAPAAKLDAEIRSALSPSAKPRRDRKKVTRS